MSMKTRLYINNFYFHHKKCVSFKPRLHEQFLCDNFCDKCTNNSADGTANVCQQFKVSAPVITLGSSDTQKQSKAA